jgi:hypothetical protein
MLNRTSLTAGCLGLLALAIAPTADARQLTAYGAFRPSPNSASQQCVTNTSAGAAINACSSSLTTMVFDLPIETYSVTTGFQVSARSFGSGTGSFSCQAVAVNSVDGSATFGTPQTFASSGVDFKGFMVAVPTGWALRLQCNNVPRNRGLLSIYWTNLAPF